MFITNKNISRRTVLKGIGVTMALPLLEAMVPARALAQGAAAGKKLRFVAIEMVHGAAGSAPIGAQKHLWSPAATGNAFDLSPSSLAPLEPFRDYLTIVSNTDVRNAEAFTAPEIGGDHFRSSAVFLTQSHLQADAGIGPARRHLDRSDLRQEARPGHADSVDAAVHRERRPVGRLLLRLFVRLHRLDQLGVAGSAAADDPRPARGVRSAVRRRRDAGRSQGAAHRGPEHPRLARHVDRADEEGSRRRATARGSTTTSTTSARSSAASRRSRRTTPAASSASCRARRSACPTRSPSTSS